ncbi:carboxylesterase family protein [Corynebacterium sp. TA-R-1]|uniref:Carboxylic ester hydrolase n=1 Tax=Corynebacterium stercoris TaxID=2943490 RepID=A0ABT1FZ22_9CORY|nr:carboxylesterase family protein [Corynebacterium stercoris]MCP1386857.1 carboxylesterase family protein [Corynebacterium stercoris]
MPHTEVTCAAGTIVGTTEDGVRHFHSVEYSRIPRAFDDPRPAEQGVLIDATSERPGIPALSITAPAGAKTLADLPVLVWIHGGRFESGDHTETFSNPEGFAREGVIHVRVGYRLKFPGLLPFPTDPPGHYRAVADCAAALTWIQRNIEAFGGDPTNVTVMGQSAGAAIVLWLARRDHYRGEFRRALAMSPAFPRRGFESRKWAARGAIGKPLTRDSLNELFEHDPARVERAYQRFRTQYITDMALGPYPLDAAELAEVPIVLSATDQEFFDSGAPFDRAALYRLLGPRLDLKREAASDYFAAVQRIAPGHPAGQLFSDSLCRRFVDRVAEGAPGPIYLAEHVGARHSEDLTPMFRGALHEWVLGFIRSGKVGWERYDDRRLAARRTMDGKLDIAHDPFGYLRGCFID